KPMASGIESAAEISPPNRSSRRLDGWSPPMQIILWCICSIVCPLHAARKPNNDTFLVAGCWDTVFASEADHFAGGPVQFEAVTRLKVVRHRGLHHWRKTCHRTLKLCRKGRRKHDASRMTNGHCLETEKSPLPGALRARQPRGSCRRVMPHTPALHLHCDTDALNAPNSPFMTVQKRLARFSKPSFGEMERGRLRRARRRRRGRGHHESERRAGRLALAMELRFQPARTPTRARLRSDARGSHGGVRQKLAA